MRFAVLFLILALAPHASFADEPLIYRDNVKDPREEAALEMLISSGKFTADLPYLVAASDLNGDGVDEWVFRQDRESACDPHARCTYLLVGLSERKPILLGDITARKIWISDEKIYGVRQVFVYNQPNDDFAYERYVWTPASGAFLPQ